jgi:hypothetical protein
MTVGDLKTRLEMLDPKTPLAVKTTGYSVDSRDVLLEMLPMNESLELEADVVDGVCVLRNSKPEDMICAPEFG